MATTITLSIPDAAVTDVIDAMAWRYNYTTNKTVGETKAQFAKRMLIEFTKTTYVDYLARIASDAAIATSNATSQQLNIT